MPTPSALTRPGAPQAYAVPVPGGDVRPAEAMAQMCQSLATLEELVTDVFSRITTRAASEKSRITNLDERLAGVRNKIAQVSGSNKATTVMSPAKYPADEKVKSFVPAFHDAEIKDHNGVYRLTEPYTTFAGPRDPINDFSYISNRDVEEVGPDTMQEGLGRLPRYLPSVSSLLLFNTSENPYKKYMSLDNLAGTDREVKEEEKKDLAAAPTTVLEGDVLPEIAMINYIYKPAPMPVPELNLPSALPIPDVADIQWSMDVSLPSIAPSQVQSEMPSLPTVEDLEGGPAAGGNAPPPPPPGDAPPPPPPPGNAPPPPPPPAGNAPPPPPPPPAPAANAPAAPPPPPPANAPAEVAAPSDGRNALLESIRNPGIRLKKANKSGGDNDTAAAAAPPPTTIQDDLLNRLKQRRRGIGGRQDDEPKKSAPAPAQDDAPAGFNMQMSGLDQMLDHADGSSGSDEDDSDWD